MDDKTEKAINLLKDLVKESHIKGQMHIDMSLAPANKLEEYAQAMAVVRDSINKDELSEMELKSLLEI